jgi:hypothetical protein
MAKVYSKNTLVVASAKDLNKKKKVNVFYQEMRLKSARKMDSVGVFLTRKLAVTLRLCGYVSDRMDTG